eukprot:Tamp_21015.p1 GENE.Tamp_21015~~Tamp_21015.p1  ORF type:complete len:267 (+),score=48.55 Tamp_21015:96-803(+)
MAAGGPPLQCVIVTRMCSEPVGEPGGTARRQATRLVAWTSALLAGAALPAPCRAFFGIGEPFTVFEEEEDGAQEGEYPVYGSREIMKKKKHGTSDKPVMKNLKFGCDYELADKICCFNRHFAENAGYFKKTRWLSEVDGEETTYYDSVTGKPLFSAPRGRTFEAFVKESKVHGWPSFRDEEVVWDNVRCLRDGECVSLTGTHLGHNLPDKSGNRYCINLVSIAGNPNPVNTRSFD